MLYELNHDHSFVLEGRVFVTSERRRFAIHSVELPTPTLQQTRSRASRLLRTVRHSEG